VIGILVIKKDYGKKKKEQVQVERKKMDTTIHVPVYDGKEKKIDEWREKFEA